jgi:hypothetical protein
MISILTSGSNIPDSMALDHPKKVPLQLAFPVTSLVLVFEKKVVGLSFAPILGMA